MLPASRLLSVLALVALTTMSSTKSVAASNHDTLQYVEQAMADYLALQANGSTTTSAPTEAATSTPIQTFDGPNCHFSAENATLLTVDCKTDHLRFIGLGDWGETSDTAGVLAVRDGVWAAAATGDYEYILALGDNYYENGVANVTDSQWHTSWYDRFEIGTKLTLPWLAILGNHDWYGNATAQIDYGLSGEDGSQFWMMPSKFFNIVNTVSSGDVLKMVVADTMTLNSTEDFAWLEQEYTDYSAAMTLAIGHHHLYSEGGAGDNTNAPMVKLREMIDGNDRVKAYIAGHEHDMQYLRANGTDYFQQGGGGRTISIEDHPGTEAEVVFYKAEYGFATYDIDLANHTMDITYFVYSLDGEFVDELTFHRFY
ncbi:hypothetical protein BBJ28_00007526 [Nothophytophthora sp. Chile5]|nr:hypothetical protein BBJ28_00007526 [Nothophytophthora sp. Chile5]